MKIMGISDEAANLIENQIRAVQSLGWTSIEMRNTEVPGFPKGNFHSIPDEAFDRAAGLLKDSGLEVYSFGSSLMNWATKWSDPFPPMLEETKRCVRRMQRTNTRYVRIMSFKPDDDQNTIPMEVFKRVREIVKMFLDAGIQPLHENCMNHGGMSWKHALELLDNCPGLKWLFDPANPCFNPDRSKPQPWPRQDPLEYWMHVRDHVAHIHIKDAIWNPAKNDADYKWPGEGHGKLREILRDAFARGYDAGISIEPHMVVVFHEAASKADDTAIMQNFIEYGRHTEQLIAEIKAESKRHATA